MTHWNHYIITEPKQVTLEAILNTLQAANPEFWMDEDVILLPDKEYGELDYGQVTIETFANPVLLPDKEFFIERIESKQNKERLQGFLANARSMVTIQMFNVGIWWDREYTSTLAPLQEWLIDNFEGVLYVEGGEFYDCSGLIE